MPILATMRTKRTVAGQHTASFVRITVSHRFPRATACAVAGQLPGPEERRQVLESFGGTRQPQRGRVHLLPSIPNADKVSLHASGQQHISISSDVAMSVGAESRFRNRSNEPVFDSEAAATFALLLPPWGVGLDPADFPKEIKQDELLIVGHSQGNYRPEYRNRRSGQTRARGCNML